MLPEEGLTVLEIRKNHFPIICAIIALTLFVACGGKSADGKIRNDVALSDVSTAVASVLSDDALVSVSSTYISGSMKMNVSDYDSFDVRINSKGINIDEYGVFRAKDSSQVALVEKAVSDYLQMRKDTWMKEYMPEEFPKLENAEIKIAGNYVIYAILSDSDRTAAFDAFEKALTA